MVTDIFNPSHKNKFTLIQIYFKPQYSLPETNKWKFELLSFALQPNIKLHHYPLKETTKSHQQNHQINMVREDPLP